MKKLVLTLCLGILTLSVFAQYGTMTVTSPNNLNFWLFIDDVLQNEYAVNSIRIQGLQYAPYKVRVEMENADNSIVGRTVVISNNANNNHFTVTNDRKNNYMFEKSRFAVNPFFVQNVILPDYSYYSSYQQYLYPGFGSVNYGQSRGGVYQRPQGNRPGPGHNPGPGSGYGGPGPSSGGHGGSNYNCLSNSDFNRAHTAVKNENSDKSKLNVAKQIANTNPLCASQIAQICRLFTFEDSKLEFAKYAYRNCVDKNNYYLINDVFTFSDSKEELRRFISR
jgi:hypothetical protein